MLVQRGWAGRVFAGAEEAAGHSAPQAVAAQTSHLFSLLQVVTGTSTFQGRMYLHLWGMCRTVP